MKKPLRFSVLLFLFIFVIFPTIESIYVSAGALIAQASKSLSNKEKAIGSTKIGSQNSRSSFEIITHELVGFDDKAMITRCRLRHYIAHKGSVGSYIHQKTPVGALPDNKKVTTFPSWINKHAASKIRLCGEETVIVKLGIHVAGLRDIKGGALTVMNVTKSTNISLSPYSVKFPNDDGMVLKTQAAERYKNASAPKVSNKIDKTLIGWDKPFRNAREDLVIIAQYATNTYTVNFLDWDGRVLKTQTASHGGSAPPPSSPAREGCIFQGWGDDYTNTMRSRTITASYKIQTSIVTFDPNGGSFVTSQTITYGDKADTPTGPVKKNNKFMSWCTAVGVRYDFRQPVKNSMMLYAYWDEESIVTAQGVHIFEDLYTTQEWWQIRLEQAKAQDKKDDDTSARPTVFRDTTNLKRQGIYGLTYGVKDSVGSHSEKNTKAIVLDKHAQEDRSRKYIRSISADHTQTLHPDNYWRATTQFQRLTQSLQKTSAQAEYTWHLTAEDIAKIRGFSVVRGYSTQENKTFPEEFSYLRR